jgi:hypothetical protein
VAITSVHPVAMMSIFFLVVIIIIPVSRVVLVIFHPLPVIVPIVVEIIETPEVSREV